jgi:hypothetical protein
MGVFMLNICWYLAVLVSAATIFTPLKAAQAYPASSWRTRNTGFSNEDQCIRRAFRAMSNANLTYEASGDIGIFGRTDQTIVYVLCLNGGSLAAIFCATDGDINVSIVCDSVTRYIAP